MIYVVILSVVLLLPVLLKCRKKIELIIADVRVKTVGATHMFIAIFDENINMKYNRTELPKKSGEVAVVTGGGRGLGIDVVKMLMKCDMHVIIACRNLAAGEKVEQLARDAGIKTGSMEVMKLDLASFKSIKEFSENVTKKHPKIKILINNAGLLDLRYLTTEQGFEAHFGINYLGHFLLSHYLLPNMIAAGTPETKSRIINVTSCAQLFGKIQFDDINMKNLYVGDEAYAQSKLAQIVFTNYIDKKFKKENIPIESFSVHPGVCDTEMCPMTHVLPPWITKYILKNNKQGAVPIVYAAVSSKLENKGGNYINNCRIRSVNNLANSSDLQQTLFSLSKDLVHIKEFGVPN